MPGKLELTVLLTRVMLPFLTLVALAAACMGMLNSLDRYFVPALAPAMFNVASILTTIVAVPLLMRMGLPPISAMAIGVLIGGLAQMLVQWPALRREGYRYQAGARSARAGTAPGAAADGPGHARPGRDAGQRLREHRGWRPARARARCPGWATHFA